MPKAKSEPRKTKKAPSCRLIQWGKMHIVNNVLSCPECGTEAETIISFFGTPGYAHKIPTRPAPAIRK